MDDRRFDSLVKELAAGKSRRRVLKGLLGLGGAALTATLAVDGETEAARRPAPTPVPVKCPGQQIPVAGQCVCPGVAPNKCGPACCTDIAGGPALPGHSECCDGACCAGTCYGEELCCPTNYGGTRAAPILPTHQICQSEGNGTECCAFDQHCCEVDGCCDTLCSDDGHCCAPEDACPGGGDSPDLCCVNNLSTSSVCCGGGTNGNACFESVVGICCTDADCLDSCQVCDLDTHLCIARCDLTSETCCTDRAGAVECVTGECCIDAEPGCEDSVCCQGDGRTVCVQGDTCGCRCENEADCCPIDDVFFTCVDLTQPGACCTDAECSEDEICCHGDGGTACVPGDSCDAVVCTCENQDDCCFRNGLFYACVDRTPELACCISADCDVVADPQNCVFGSCIDFICRPISTCGEGQTCCPNGCVDGDTCPAETCEIASDCASLVCCNGDCCADGQRCCDSGCSDEPCSGGSEGGVCQSPSQCLSTVCCSGVCCIQGQRCCEGACSDEECLPTCSNPNSCAQGQTCCDGFHCCNGGCIADAEECPIG